MAKITDKDKTLQRPIKHTTEVLLGSKALGGYQKDFAKALLTKSEYTVEEAKAILDKFFEKEAR